MINGNGNIQFGSLLFRFIRRLSIYFVHDMIFKVISYLIHILNV